MTSDVTQPSVKADRVRLVFLMTPADGLSDEQFKNYWLENHGPLFTSLPIVKKNVLKYEQVRATHSSVTAGGIDSTVLVIDADVDFQQFHIEPSFIEPFAATEPGLIPSPYKGMAIFEAESMEKLFEVFQDEKYMRLVRPDEQRFIKMTAATPVAGTFATFLNH